MITLVLYPAIKLTLSFLLNRVFEEFNKGFLMSKWELINYNNICYSTARIRSENLLADIGSLECDYNNHNEWQ